MYIAESNMDLVMGNLNALINAIYTILDLNLLFKQLNSEDHKELTHTCSA